MGTMIVFLKLFALLPSASRNQFRASGFYRKQQRDQGNQAKRARPNEAIQ
jgi:hypothetical protein